MKRLKKAIKKFLKLSWLGIAILLAPNKTSALEIAIAAPPMPPMAPTKQELLFKIAPFFLIFIALVTSVIGTFWYQKNKKSKKWYEFFTSIIFLITFSILLLMSIHIGWWLLNR